MHYASRAALFIHCPPRFLSAFRTLPPASQPQTPSSIIFLLVLFGSRRISRRVFAVYTSVPMFSIRIRRIILRLDFLFYNHLFQLLSHSSHEHVQKPSSITFPLASFRYLEFTEISLDRFSVQACTVDNVICPDRYRNELFARFIKGFIKRIFILLSFKYSIYVESCVNSTRKISLHESRLVKTVSFLYTRTKETPYIPRALINSRRLLIGRVSWVSIILLVSGPGPRILTPSAFPITVCVGDCSQGAAPSPPRPRPVVNRSRGNEPERRDSQPRYRRNVSNRSDRSMWQRCGERCAHLPEHPYRLPALQRPDTPSSLSRCSVASNPGLDLISRTASIGYHSPPSHSFYFLPVPSVRVIPRSNSSHVGRSWNGLWRVFSFSLFFLFF